MTLFVVALQRPSSSGSSHPAQLLDSGLRIGHTLKLGGALIFHCANQCQSPAHQVFPSYTRPGSTLLSALPSHPSEHRGQIANATVSGVSAQLLPCFLFDHVHPPCL